MKSHANQSRPCRGLQGLVLVGCVGLSTAVHAEEVEHVAKAVVELRDRPRQTGWTADAWVSQEYRFRSAGSGMGGASEPLGEAAAQNPANDQDLRLTFDGQILGMDEHLAGTLSAALFYDLDGHVAQGTPDLFGDSHDFRQPLAVFYTLSAEWRRSLPLDHLTLGRQQSTHGLPVTFDGASIDLRLLDRRLNLFAFGGHTVHFFETQPGFFEDWLGSAGAGLRITPNVQVELDSRILHERVPTQDGGRATVDTNSYGAALTARWETLQGKLFARGMNRSFSHVGGSFRLQVPQAAMGVDGQATAQLVSLGEVAESENPFYSLLGSSLPHLRARLEAWKEFAVGDKATLTVAAGARVRQLLHDDPTPFNRNANAMYLRADLNDLFKKGLFASATAEWNLPSATDQSSLFSLGGSVGYLSRKAKAELGTYYQRFKINYYRDVEELQDTRTVYAMGSYRVFSQIEMRGRYVLEILDRTIHTAYLTLREDF
jgi:hypothetical protein